MGMVHKKVAEMALLQNVIYHDLLRAVLADIKPQFELFFSSRLFRNQRGFQSLCAFSFNDGCLI